MLQASHCLLFITCLAISVPADDYASEKCSIDIFSSAAYPQSIWRPSLLFYLFPLIILFLATSKRISADCRLIYGQLY